MAKTHRRVYEKYTRGNHAGLVLKQLCPNIGALLQAIEDHLVNAETIDVHEWTGHWYYIVIEDSRFKEYPEDARCGFTVNIKTDTIMWNDDTSENRSGGNCFLRSRRWKAFINKHWAGTITDQKMRFYKDWHKGKIPKEATA